MNKIEQIVYDKSGVIVEFDCSQLDSFFPNSIFWYTIDGRRSSLLMPLTLGGFDVDGLADQILDNIQQVGLELVDHFGEKVV